MPFGQTQSDGERGVVSNRELPYVSEKLNSVRAYNFECIFDLPRGVESTDSRLLRIAAKQITVPGLSIEEIAVNRFNDTVYYPGKIKKEDLRIIFDDLYASDVSVTLFNWFRSIYDPITGLVAANNFAGDRPFKANSLKIISLDGEGAPVYETSYFGVWPKSWKGAEFNYATNEFHTIEVNFAYDYMNHENSQG